MGFAVSPWADQSGANCRVVARRPGAEASSRSDTGVASRVARKSAKYPRYLMLVVGCRFLQEGLTLRLWEAGEDAVARRGVPLIHQ